MVGRRSLDLPKKASFRDTFQGSILLKVAGLVGQDRKDGEAW